MENKIPIIGGRHSGRRWKLLNDTIHIDGEVYVLSLLELDGEYVHVYVCKSVDRPLRQFIDEMIWEE